jgi:hypothetical protein
VLSDGQQADGSLGSGTGYVVIDTNIALHQMDLLEDTAVRDIVVPVVVRDEVKHRNTAAYNRLQVCEATSLKSLFGLCTFLAQGPERRWCGMLGAGGGIGSTTWQALCADKERGFYVFANEFHAETYVEAAAGETPNDRNDRAIRATAMWYKKHLPHISIVLLTDDRLNLKAAEEDGLVAHTVRQIPISRACGWRFRCACQGAANNNSKAKEAQSCLSQGAAALHWRKSQAPRPNLNHWRVLVRAVATMGDEPHGAPAASGPGGAWW